MPNNDGDIDVLIELDMDALLRHLGSGLRTPATPPGPSGDRRIGIAWIRSHWAQLKEALCGSTFNNALNEDPDAEDKVRDSAALIDIALLPVLARIGFEAPTATVAVIIAKYGLGRLCAEDGFSP